MKVQLIDYTGIGTGDPERYAMNLLAFTKSTRLDLRTAMDFVTSMSDLEIRKEIDYISKTVPSSWEFVHYTFLISGVTRAFTHQLVRTRTASYAQQAMRVADMSGFDYLTGPTIASDGVLTALYEREMKDINDTYTELVNMGARAEDARGILPTNILTNICMSINLRALTDLIRKRSSSRVQGEYRDVVEKLRSSVLEVHPFASSFIDNDFDKVAEALETSLGHLGLTESRRVELVKLIDQMKAMR